MLREMPAVVPSRCFGNSLRQRIRHEATAATPALRRWSGVAGAMLIATVIGMVGWEDRDRSAADAAPDALVNRSPTDAPTWDIRNNPVLRFAQDTAPYPEDPFHPIPFATDLHGVMYAHELRFETLAVWNGR